MTQDDRIRRAAIQDLLCQSRIDIPQFEESWKINFADYFAPDLIQIRTLARDALVDLTDQYIDITPRGRFLARIIAMCFDRHLRHASSTAKFSRVL